MLEVIHNSQKIKAKNLILYFIAETHLDIKNEKRHEKINETIKSFLKYIPDERKTEFQKIEDMIEELISSLKWNYIDYGAGLNEVLENYNLNLVPKVEE